MQTRPLQMGLLLAALALLLIACGQEEPPEYFRSAIPPCTPVEGVDVDPCEPKESGPAGHKEPNLEGNHPYTIRWYLGAEQAAGIMAAHIVVRATYLPGTARCRDQEKVRAPAWTSLPDIPGLALKCYMDVRVNEYYLGSGPSMLTVVVLDDFGGRDPARVERSFASRDGREAVLFLGPALDYTVEALQDFNRWFVQREQGTALAIHPWRDFWLGRDPTLANVLAVPLTDFGAAVTAAQTVRLADYGGRVADPAIYTAPPMLERDANKLHDFYVAAGAMDHPDGPPGQPPPSCSDVVTNPLENTALLADCSVLLGVKDQLRGRRAPRWVRPTLNWSVDVAMADWDGVGVQNGRVVRSSWTTRV